MIRRLGPAAFLALISIGAAAHPDRSSDPPEPDAVQAVSLVLRHRTNASVTVAETLRYAERARPDTFRVARHWAEQRPGEPAVRVHLCYWLRDSGRQAQPTCGIDYLVSVNPPHVEPVEAFTGLGRDLQAGRESFVRGLDRERAIRRDPTRAALHDALDRYNPYDWR